MLDKVREPMLHTHDEACDCNSQNDSHCGCEGEHDPKDIKAPVFIIGVVFFAAGLIIKNIDMGISEAILPWLVLGIFAVAFLLVGKNVLLNALNNIRHGQVFDENFLMSIAGLGAFLIGEYPEASAVMIFYRVGEYMQHRAVDHSKKSIEALMDIRPDVANVMRDGKIDVVAAENVKVGDIIVVKPGEKVPLDGEVSKGASSMNMVALTGESVPVDVAEGSVVLSGSVNEHSQIEVRVTKIFSESTVTKIINLVQNASNKKAKTENFITTFAKYYTPAVVIFAVLLAIVPPLLGIGTFSEWIYRALVFLVVSCPCALVIAIPLGYFGGIGAASSRGILVKGGNYLEALNNVDTVVFDKTGTLTSGSFDVHDVRPAEGISKDEVLNAAAHAESSSSHPIAKSIISAYGKDIDQSSVSDVTEKAGYGVTVSYKGRTIQVGNRRMVEAAGLQMPDHDNVDTIAYVIDDNKYMGAILIGDELKKDAHSAISGLKSRGIKLIGMLTGDNKDIANDIGNKLGVDTVKSELLPHNKVEALEEILDRDTDKVVFVGDGINDAPVLARADIGVAMGGLGSDAAIEAADIVIMNDEPSKLNTALDVAKKTKKIVWQNIIFALGVKGIVLAFAAFGFATMWEAVFADVGVALLAVLNSTRANRVKE